MPQHQIKRAKRRVIPFAIRETEKMCACDGNRWGLRGAAKGFDWNLRGACLYLRNPNEGVQ
jgi:hypothetical protein